MIVGLKHIIFILGLGAILASNLLHAQGPDLWQVIGGAGFTGVSGDLTISATVGETAIGSGHEKLIDVDIFHYTEGFQQTDDYVPNPNLEVSTYSNQAQCPDVHDGTLDVFPTGCKDPYTITLAGNGDTIVVEDVSTAGHTFTALDSGEYQVTVRGVTLCAYSELARVDLKNDDCDVEVYTGITPNGDGKNDKWIIDNVEINLPNEVTIFSRWGQKVWQASNYNNETIVWIGLGQSGNTLPDGTYFYTIEVSGNSSASKSGWIQVTR